MTQHDSPTPPPSGPPTSAPGTPYGGARSGFAGRGTRFFDWMRSLGIVRSDGWLGGVSAGVAHRIGIDPLIVRGIIVVAALLGAPLLLLYAAAWALLPDRSGRIHLQRLFDGEFEPAMVGIGVMALLALLPWSAGPWWIETPIWDVPSWGAGIGRAFWTLAVLAAIVGLIVAAVYSTRNSGRAGGSAWPTYGAGPAAGTQTAAPSDAAGPSEATAPSAASTAPATAAMPDPTLDLSADESAPTREFSSAMTEPTEDLSSATAAMTAPTEKLSSVPRTPTLDVSAEPTEPPAPGPGASAEDLAEWQARHAAWATEHAQWKQRLQADMRAVKAQRSAELRAQSAAAAAESGARRRAYRAAHPRISASFGWATIGIALLAAALTAALWPALTGTTGFGVTAALAAATLVFGVAILGAGLLRRRSGFILFLGLLLAALTLGSAFVPHGQLVVGGVPLASSITPSSTTVTSGATR